MNENCIFCNIIAEKEKCYKVYSDNIITAFLDIDPINEGHLLLIPNNHYLDIDEIPNDVISHMFTYSKHIVKALKKVYDLEGYSIIQNGGKFNDIGHFHLHIFPRYSNDGFSWQYLNKEKLVNEKIAKDLSNFIKQEINN